MWKISGCMGAFLGAFFLLHGKEYKSGDETDAGPIAVSGGAEVYQIDITRRKASYAAKGADLTNMTLSVWYPELWKGNSTTQYLVKLTNLDPVIDDTGKLLSTKERRESIGVLQGEVFARETFGCKGKFGPVITMMLEAPARRATTLKTIKGKAEVARVRFQTVKFDLASVIGKPLRHPLLKGVVIRPSTRQKDGQTIVALWVPTTHDRLVQWEVEASGLTLEWTSLGKKPGAGSIEIEQNYEGKLPKGCLLVAKIAVPIETRIFEFNFQNVALP
jgi:hypothetical protein